MNDLERAKKEFFAKNWEAGIAAAKKTNMEDPVLRYFFGYCREHGYGMERNDADAVTWYRLAAKQGYREGLYRLAGLYECGRGVAQDLEAAFSFYGQAAEQGLPCAQYCLGRMYEKGSGVAMDIEKAREWYGKAAGNGDADAREALERLNAAFPQMPSEQPEEDEGERMEMDASSESEEDEPSETVEDVLAELDQLVGIGPVKDEIHRLTATFRVLARRRLEGLPVSPSSYHCVFSGSPGTGKTTVARVMARVYRALGVIETDNLVEVDRSDLVAKYVGQTAAKTNAVIDSALDGVLFIDEAYALANGGPSDYGHEAVETLLKRMEDDRDRLVVVIAGYTDKMKTFIAMNPGLRSRFTRYIEFPDYSVDELTEIFVRMAKQEEYVLMPNVLSRVRLEMERWLAKATKSFGNARSVRNLFERAKEHQAQRLEPSLDELTREEMTELSLEDVDGACRCGNF